MLKLYANHPQLFNIPRKDNGNIQNESQQVAILCQCIDTKSCLDAVSQRDMSEHTHGDAWDFVNDAPLNTDYKYCMQALILEYVCNKWGTTSEAAKKLTTSNFVRCSGCMLLPIFYEHLHVILDMRKDRNVENEKQHSGLDDPILNKSHAFQHLLEIFVDCMKYPVAHPDGWNKFENHLEFKEIEPNNMDRARLSWAKDNMNKLYNVIKVQYKEVMDLWTKGTGGGDGRDEGW